ncbi:MAG: cysteine desulfurase family protein [[Clostridium] aminophilum]|uniref:cysteine desulfurase family protein n=1 Tax=[Clostridium] aminophilum TaxID=1526 RepID=UPI0026F1C046|nr:cysteine desulfurase family protein [[Clostridium] aminophilum]MDD6196834.1 cysteine desulfurase family protein [[Clostridium] aminophilum]
MEAYFDNSATTRVYDEVAEAVLRAMTTDYGNPSSMHTKGMEAENLVREARKTIADTLKVTEREIVFTSGGTESNNMALYGTAYSMRRMGKHIITSGVEHASIYQPLTFLEEMGYEITYLPVDENGRISLEQLRESIRKDTILVSIMYVNNEIGAVEPVEEIAKVIHETNPRTVFHVDAIQAYGKYRIRPKKMGIDLLSVSGHKIHGPKGTGFLYIGEKIHVHPIILGGGQQRDMRSGTENVPGCYGLGVAAKMAYTGFEKRIDRFYELRDRLISGLHEIEGTTVNGFEDRRNAPQIVSCSFEGIRAEVLLHALERKEIYVSSGSACSSNHPGISGTLKAIGVKKELLDSTLRFSLGSFNNEEQIDYVIAQLKEILPELRKFRRY